VLAAGTWLSWNTDDHSFSAPYFEQGGEPVLLVERQASEALLSAGYAISESHLLPELGTLRLGGALWPVAGDTYLAAVREFRLLHAECADCCGPLRSHLVGVRLDRVELAPPGADGFIPIRLDAYAAAVPDPVIGESVRVRTHLNSEHSGDLLLMASRLLGVPTDELAAASVDWIDAHGLDLTVIDDQGSHTLRCPFRQPLTTMDDLGRRLHWLLNHQ